ncbi:ferredoxin [Aeromicrobium sp. CTD01-1L150]|uniref:ferredoxin n=1 Tax=Aeromicrobium sp. CTD01-1L150 TaxID=3341830 RepID=UPI0035C12040
MSRAQASVSVRSEQCAANGSCQHLAPTVFGADEHGWVTVLQPSPSQEVLEDVLDAAESCPMAVIGVHDETGASLV